MIKVIPNIFWPLTMYQVVFISRKINAVYREYLTEVPEISEILTLCFVEGQKVGTPAQPVHTDLHAGNEEQYSQLQ